MNKPVEVTIAPKKRSAAQKVSKQAFKNHVTVKLGYSDNFQINTGPVGVFNYQIFNMNAIYDPDHTFTGHQPYGRDTYAAIYSKYRVRSIKYKIDAIGNSGQPPMVVGVLPNQSLNSVGSMSLLQESPYGKSMLVSFGEGGTLRGTVDLAKFTGRTKSQYLSDSIYEAGQGQVPSEVMGLHLGYFAPSTLQSYASLSIRIEYLVDFWDPIQQAQS